VAVGAYEFDAGGVSFDFEKISRKQVQNSKNRLIGENFVKNGDFSKPVDRKGVIGWKNSNIVRQIANKKLAGIIAPEIKYSIENTPEGKAAVIKKSLKIQDVFKKNTMRVPGDWIKCIQIPDNSGGEYKLRFKYQGMGAGKYGGKALVKMTFHKAGGKGNPYLRRRTRKTYISGQFPLNKKWTLFDRTIKVPKETGWIVLTVRLYGTGELFFKDVELKRYAVAEQDISINLSPMSYLDNTFYFSKNNPGLMLFAWKQNKPVSRAVLKKTVFCLQVPDFLNVKDVAKNGIIGSAKKEKNSKIYRIQIRNFAELLRKNYWVNGCVSVLAMPDGKTGLQGKALYWLESGGRRLSAEKTFNIKIMPEISVSSKLKNFFSGIDTRGNYSIFANPETNDLYSKFWAQTGINLVIERTALYGQSKEVIEFAEKRLETYRKNGIKAIIQNLAFLINGYVIGPPANKPVYAKFKSSGKSSHYHVKLGTCPAAVYRRSNYFKQDITNYLNSSLKVYDGVWMNWEPYMFCGRGCFCERCRDDFIAFSKLPAAGIKAAWPSIVMAGQEYNDKWKKFKCSQQGRVIKTIQDCIAKTAGKIGAIPGISWPIATDSLEGKNFSREYDVVSYGSLVKFLNPWGPYNFWKASQPYSYNKGAVLKNFIAGKTVKKYVDKTFKPVPGLIGFTHGLQGHDWVTQPENIAMDNLSYFLNKYRSAVVYRFPVGYDNRYWKAIAESNSIIARYEDYVTNGKSIENITVEAISPYPGKCRNLLGRWMPEMSPVSLLQVVGFKRGDDCLAAVGNFWEKGDVFFKLKIKGLQNCKLYTVRSPDKNTAFLAEGKSSFSASDLEKGVLLHVGALRWAFFVISPASGNAHRDIEIKPDELRRAILARAKILRKKATEDNNDSGELTTKKLTPVENGGLSARSSVFRGENGVLFVSGKNKIFLSFKGMKVAKWQVDGKEYVCNRYNTGLGTPAFWLPAHITTCNFSPDSMRVVEKGIQILGTQSGDMKNPFLKNLVLKQSLKVSRDCRTIVFNTKITNIADAETGSRDIKFGFRYNNLPDNISSIMFSKNGESVKFKRQFVHRIFAHSSSALIADVAEKFKIKSNYTEITGNSAMLIGKGMCIKVTAAPEKLFEGSVIGDYATLPTVTYEPLFKQITLKPGETISFSQIFQLGD
jgi:hypothetical protein